jgi:Family of unknown function (DUF5681)
MIKSSEGYEVGYRKPPVVNRFKKGQSGNQKGRPKKETQKLDPGEILQSIDNEEITVKIDGKVQRLRKAEVHFQQQFTRAIKGDLVSAKLIAKMASQYFGPEAIGPGETQWIVVPNREIAWQGPASKENLKDETQHRNKRHRKKALSADLTTQSPASIGFLFRKIAWDEIVIDDGQGAYKISRWQAYVRQTYNLSLNKNNGAAKLLDQLRRRFPGKLLPGDPITFVINDSDAKL